MSLHEQTHYYGAHGFMGDLVMEFDLKDEENEVGCNRKLLSPKVNVVYSKLPDKHRPTLIDF